MSPGITSYLTQLLTGPSGRLAAGPLQIRAIGGGSINTTYQLTYHERQWFCKINEADRYPDLFVLERQGLALLGSAGPIRVPAVIDCNLVADKQVLVLEWVREGLRSARFWQTFGEQLARLHHTGSSFSGQEPGGSYGPDHNPSFDPDRSSPFGLDRSSPFGLDRSSPFGLDHDNYMGSLPQSNRPHPDWAAFFALERLQPQVRMAREAGLLDKAAVQRFEKLYDALPAIFPPEPPALLHGDLWSGNFLCDEDERPVLIDPAAYYGHRSIDLAMTTLFGGFERPFYEAYHYHYPFPANHQEQWEICNLYPLLIHLNLFGARPSGELLRHAPPRSYSSPALGYARNILHTIQRF